tara:strand:+ start:2476 stop:2724 length:249 start_codon:yes stop_codon:yes gene_type:complete
MPRPSKHLNLTEKVQIKKPQLKKVIDNIRIKNLSLQGLEMCFNGDGKFDSVWLGPRQEREIPRSYLSDQILNLQEQRMIRIS